jgi:hypothetical protein
MSYSPPRESGSGWKSTTASASLNRDQTGDQTQPNPLELEVDTSLGSSGAVRAIQHLGTELIAASSTAGAVAPRSAAMLEAIAASISEKDKSASIPPWQMTAADDGEQVREADYILHLGSGSTRRAPQIP